MATERDFKHNARMSTLNAIFWSLGDGLTATFIIPFALAIGANSIEIGVVGAIPFVAAILAQVPGAELVERWRNRRLVNNFCELIAKLAWLPIILIPFAFQSSSLAVFVAFLFVSHLMVQMSVPAWLSLIASIAPKKRWGEFLGERRAVMGVAMTVSSIAAGFLLDAISKGGLQAFSYVFAAGALIGMMNIIPVSRMREPAFRDHDHKLRDFLKVPRELKQLILFRSWFNFAFMFAGPFFAVFMLANLKMSYGEFVSYSAVATVAGILLQKRWGEITDHLGDKSVLIASILGVSVVPVLFSLATPDTKWILLPIQAFSGIVWAGFWVAADNLLLDYTDDKKRAVQVADFNMITSIPMIIAPIAGGLAASYTLGSVSGILLVFAITTLLRISSLAFVTSLPDRRSRREHTPAAVYRQVISVHPVKGAIYQLHAATECVKCVWNARLRR